MKSKCFALPCFARRTAISQICCHAVLRETGSSRARISSKTSKPSALLGLPFGFGLAQPFFQRVSFGGCCAFFIVLCPCKARELAPVLHLSNSWPQVVNSRSVACRQWLRLCRP